MALPEAAHSWALPLPQRRANDHPFSGQPPLAPWRGSIELETLLKVASSNRERLKDLYSIGSDDGYADLYQTVAEAASLAAATQLCPEPPSSSPPAEALRTSDAAAIDAAVAAVAAADAITGDWAAACPASSKDGSAAAAAPKSTAAAAGPAVHVHAKAATMPASFAIKMGEGLRAMAVAEGLRGIDGGAGAGSAGNIHKASYSPKPTPRPRGASNVSRSRHRLRFSKPSMRVPDPMLTVCWVA